MKNKIISMVCLLSIIASLFSHTNTYASYETANIINAYYNPYTEQISVLVNAHQCYEVSLTVAGEVLDWEYDESGNYKLYTSKNFTVSNYGIVSVVLNATNGSTVICDKKNINVVSSFAKLISLQEDFDSLPVMTMENETDTAVSEAIKNLNDGMISVSSVPNSTYSGRFIDITNKYTPDSSSALTMRFHSVADKKLPTIVANPNNDGTNGIIEISYDLYSTNSKIRQTIFPVSRAYSSSLIFNTQDGSEFASSFRVVDYETHRFGSSSKSFIANTWYNIHFIVNLNDLNYEFYVDGELINYGGFNYSNSLIGTYVYGIDYFNLASGVQGNSSVSEQSPVNVCFDNIKITHIDTGAALSSVEYTVSGETNSADLLNCKLPLNPENITVNFNNQLSLEKGDVIIKDSNGTELDVSVISKESEPLSSNSFRTSVDIFPKAYFDIGESYYLIFSPSIKYGSLYYEHKTVIPFEVCDVPSVLYPKAGDYVNVGEKLQIKAYIPASEYADLYIDDKYIASLNATDEDSCITYLYDTSLESVGEKHIVFTLYNKDGSTKNLSSWVNLSRYNINEITACQDFEQGDCSNYFSVVKQKSADSAAMIQTQIDGRNAAGFYFVANSNTDRKVIQVQKSLTSLVSGRVALEYDMYLSPDNALAQLSISFGDGIYTFYPGDIAKQFSGGKICGASNPYYGWHRVKFIMDTVTQSSEIYFDGEKVGNTCYTFDNTYYKSGTEAPESITEFKNFTISLWQSQSYVAGETYLGFAIDNWHVYKEINLPAITSVKGDFNYNEGELIDSDNKTFEVLLSNHLYIDCASLIENFSLIADGEILELKNITISDNKLCFYVDSLPENSELEFVIGSETLLYDGLSKTGTKSVFTLKTADQNGLYLKRNINVDDGGTRVVFNLDTFEEISLTLSVAYYNYNKLISLEMKNIILSGSKNILITRSNTGITHVKTFIWNGENKIYPLMDRSVMQTYNSNSLDLTSIFEPDTKALNYIGDAVILKDDVDSMVYNGVKYNYGDLTKNHPYINDNGTFMISADLFLKVFNVEIDIDERNINIGNIAHATLDDMNVSVGGNSITLDNSFELVNNVLYVPVRSVAEDILGKCYLCDRGMHIFSEETFKYTNSESTYETKEPIDSIYRLLQFEHKKSTEIYSMMDSYLGGNAHPRILINAEDLSKIKADSVSDPVVSEALAATLAQADEYLNTDVQEYDIPDGVRLLVAARNVMERLICLSSAYLLTEKDEYADRAWLEMENCFSWPDWNTDNHYLDNSELLYGVAVAYDSLYYYLNVDQKKRIHDKTWELSLQHTVDRYQGINFSGSEWRTARSNWGFVCNGAVITAILALGREENCIYQPYYDYLLDCALQAIEYPIMLYYPDGAWDEGMAYWEYSLRYFTTSVLVPLYYCTGSTLDFLKPQGADKIADMGLYMQSGDYAFNFSDNGSQSPRQCESVYAYAMVTGNDELMQTWNNIMNNMGANHSARTLMWYRPSVNTETSVHPSLPLDKIFSGVEVGTMKEQWYNNQASTVFFKGGQNSSGGSHLDAGTFCFDSMGERWSVDPGKDSYNIEGGYNGLAGYELYVKRPEGHNCVVINPREDISGEYYGGQYLNGRAEITDAFGDNNSAFSTVDLSDVYKYDANSYIRGFYLGENRKTLVIQDEIQLKQDNSSLYWFMHTRADIELDEDGKGALLTKGSQRLRVDMVTNADNAKFVINYVGPDIQRFPTDPIREGQLQGGSFTNINVLTLEAQGSDNIYITVKLTPIDDNYNNYEDVSYIPIIDWSLTW